MSPELRRAETLEEAYALLAADGDALAYAGGTALQILRKQGVLFASRFVDIAGISSLDAIVETGSTLRVGATVSLRRMEHDGLVGRHAPVLATACRRVANPRVRNTATIGGNLAHGDYRLDPPVALLALGATVVLGSIEGTRSLPIDAFFVGFETTAVRHGELVTAIELPLGQHDVSSCYVKLSSLSANDWPCASVAAVLTRAHSRATLRIALGALAPTPVLALVDVTGMQGSDPVAAAAEAAVGLMDPIADARGGVAFKRQLGRVAVHDAVAAVLDEARHG